MEIQSASQENKAVLGEGYNTKEERFAGECVTGSTEFVGAQTSSVIFDRSLEEKEISDSLGFSVGAKARYGLYKGSLSARFASEASANDYSEATIYTAQYRFKNRKLKFEGLTSVGKAAKGTDDDSPFVGENWELICGHEYVEQITLGASLYISAKIEFSSKAEKSEFNAKFKIKGPAFSASGEFEKASTSFGSRASITIQGYQLGGDVSRLSSIFGVGASANTTSPDGKQLHSLLVCSMANPDACLQVLSNALRYATDTSDPQAFPQQIRADSDFGNTADPNGPAEISCITSPWSDLALIPPPGIITALVKAAREELSFEFERNLKYQNRVRALKTGTFNLSPDQSNSIDEIGKSVSENLRLIYNAAEICYTQLDKAVDAVADLKAQLIAIDESQLEISEEQPDRLAQLFDIKDRPDTPKTLQKTLNTLTELVKEIVVDFDSVANKSETFERVLLGLKQIALYDRDGFSKVEITDLSPFKYFVNLEDLNINQTTEIVDCSPLLSLTKLRRLAIPCRLRNLAQLSSLPSLEELTPFLDENDSDLNYLSSFISLKVLDLKLKDLTSISALSSLVNLERLFLFGNLIVDITPLASLIKLKSLILFRNQIVDVSPLSGLLDLEELLLQDNKITDTSSLSPLRKLRILALSGNPIVSRVCPIPDPGGTICTF